MLNKSQNISQFEILDLLYEYQVAKTKLDLFGKKYLMDFNSFEQQIHNKSIENFNEWDDYMEWKAYSRFFKEKSKLIKELDNEYYQLS